MFAPSTLMKSLTYSFSLYMALPLVALFGFVQKWKELQQPNPPIWAYANLVLYKLLSAVLTARRKYKYFRDTSLEVILQLSTATITFHYTAFIPYNKYGRISG
jgi:hypothetical protein